MPGSLNNVPAVTVCQLAHHGPVDRFLQYLVGVGDDLVGVGLVRTVAVVMGIPVYMGD